MSKNKPSWLLITRSLLAFIFVMAVDAISVLAAGSSGTVVGWGHNQWEQANPPAGLSDVVAISAGAWHNLALKADGTVVGWGRDDYGGPEPSPGGAQTIPPAGLSDVVAISAGSWHSLAMTTGGTLVAWGWNPHGATDVPAGLTDVVAISAGGGFNLALKADGTVVGWGYDVNGESTPPTGLTDVVAISAGSHHSLALKADGTVVGWGLNTHGQKDVPAGLSDVVAISAGGHHSLALKNDGTVVGWGLQWYGATIPPAGLTDVVAIAAGWHQSLALKADGTVVGWGYDYNGEATPPTGLTDVVAIGGGAYHSLALVDPNYPPTVDAGGPYLVAVNSTIILDGSTSDPDGDLLNLAWSADAGTFNDPSLEDPEYSAGSESGIYDLTLTGTDPDGLQGTGTTFVVVYDPDGGFVTGGGWIWSQTGWCQLDEVCGGAEGKANFGFVSRYKKGASVPSGNTEFNFSAGGLNFHSDSYEWLVVNQGGTNAQYKGTGTINGSGEYKFMLWATDNDPGGDDTFRIKIWWEEADGTEFVAYDNRDENEQPQPIGGGNIKVHDGK